MKVNYGVKIDEAVLGRNSLSEEGKLITSFLDTDQENMCFEYDSSEEAKKRVACVSAFCKRTNKIGKHFISYTKRGNKIYVIKQES